MDAQEKKRSAAKASLEFIEPGVVLGVGTGSTVNELIDLLPTVADRIDKVVSSSRESTTLLEEKGFEVSTLNEVGDVDIYIDGADETRDRCHGDVEKALRIGLCQRWAAERGHQLPQLKREGAGKGGGAAKCRRLRERENVRAI